MASVIRKSVFSPNVRLVISGEGDRLVMAGGGGTTFMDLALYLDCKTPLGCRGNAMARLYLIDWHSGGQQPYALLARSRQVDDPIIADVSSGWLTL